MIHPIYMTATFCMHLNNYGTEIGNRFQLTISGIDTSKSNLSIQLLRDGCSVLPTPQVNLTTGPLPDTTVLDLVFPSVVRTNGYALTVGATNESCPLLRFRLLASLDGGEWRPAGSSTYRRAITGLRLLDGPAAAAAGKALVADHRPPWPLFCEGLLDPILHALSLGALAAFGALGRHRAARHALAALWCLLAANAAVCAAGYLAAGSPPLLCFSARTTLLSQDFDAPLCRIAHSTRRPSCRKPAAEKSVGTAPRACVRSPRKAPVPIPFHSGRCVQNPRPIKLLSPFAV